MKFSGILSLILLMPAFAACRDRSVPEEPKPVSRQEAQVRKPSVQAKAQHGKEHRFAEPARLVAIGDVHGDLAATRAALRLAGAIDKSDQWIGGKLVVVQTGDQLDRGDQEREIVDLFERLAEQARAQGGAVHALNGNHETMNVQGDFRYVTPAGLDFGTVSPASPLGERFPQRFKQRAAAFLPGGQYANLLAERKVTVIVGDSVFAHAGVLPEHVSHGLDAINHEVSAWMRGTTTEQPPSITSQDALVWTRLYGGNETAEVCQTAQRVLAALDVRRMVVGHTVQKNGITSICNQTVWRIDVGLSAYYGGSPISVLEIARGEVRVLSAPR